MAIAAPSTTTPVPFRVNRIVQGIPVIEKYYKDFNPNCILVLLALVLSGILPLSLIGASPVASIVILVISVFFPGIPAYMANWQWKVEIDNNNRILTINKWHAFTRKWIPQMASSIKYDDIKEIVVETSPDGMRRSVMVIPASTSFGRKVLYSSMNVTHVDKFKDEFMRAIVLTTGNTWHQTSPASLGVHPASVAPANPTISTTPITPVVPFLRQFAIPDPTGNPAVDNDISIAPAPVFPAAATEVDGFLHPIPGFPATLDDDVDSFPTATADSSVTPATRDEPAKPVQHTSEQLAEIAHKKRDLLSRMFEPGTEVAASGQAQGQEKTTISCATASAVKNTSSMYNLFDECGAIADSLPAELGGHHAMRPATETDASLIRTGRAPKKKDEKEEPVINHSVHKKTERELSVQKVKPTCIVCNVVLKGTSFICPTCSTKYCIRCAKTLSGRKEHCWTCRKPLKVA
jgi:predicted RNA-binding Zn-ribbon protein involved in translation (DUF1610 family)